MDRWQYRHYALYFILFLCQKFWFLIMASNKNKKSDNGGISDNGGAGRGHILLGNSLVIKSLHQILTDLLI